MDILKMSKNENPKKVLKKSVFFAFVIEMLTKLKKRKKNQDDNFSFFFKHFFILVLYDNAKQRKFSKN